MAEPSHVVLRRPFAAQVLGGQAHEAMTPAHSAGLVPKSDASHTGLAAHSRLRSGEWLLKQRLDGSGSRRAPISPNGSSGLSCSPIRRKNGVVKWPASA
jgi:hypothetical protein